MTTENGELHRMSLLDHLQELRTRLIRAVYVVSAAFLICLIFSERIFNVFAALVNNKLGKGSSLVYLTPTEPIFVYIKLAFIAGLFVTIPYVLYQMWAFVSPGLYERERRLSAPAVILATFLFYAGGAFAYFVVLPAALKFLLGFPSESLKPMLAVQQYVSFVLMLILAFAGIFETPIIVVLLGLLGLYNSSQLRKGRRYFVVLAFIIGAILSPSPDVFNQSLMAIPMMLLYEVGIWILSYLEKKRKEADDLEAIEDEPSEHVE